MVIISPIVGHITRRERIIYDRIEYTSTRRATRMSDEDFVTGEGPKRLAHSDDVEEMLELLMKIAQSEGREFLAYLLSMALIEARNRVSPPNLSH
jgi:hypothetical protein